MKKNSPIGRAITDVEVRHEGEGHFIMEWNHPLFGHVEIDIYEVAKDSGHCIDSVFPARHKHRNLSQSEIDFATEDGANIWQVVGLHCKQRLGR